VFSWSFLKAGELLDLDDELHRVDLINCVPGRTDEIEWMRLESVLTRRCVQFSPAEMTELFQVKRLRVRARNSVPQDFYAQTGDQLDDAARRRLFYVEQFDRLQPSKSTAQLARFIDEVYPTADFPHHKPSPGSVRRWVNGRGEPGRRWPGQMRGRYPRGPRCSREPEYAQEIFEDSFEAFLRSAR